MSGKPCHWCPLMGCPWCEYKGGTVAAQAVGLLICDDAGRVTQAELDSAMADKDAVFYAEMLLSGVLK